MKQKILTDKQNEILRKLGAILKEADENNIHFIYDIADNTITAYNAENVEDDLITHTMPGNEYTLIDWDASSIVDNIYLPHFHSDFDDLYLAFV